MALRVESQLPRLAPRGLVRVSGMWVSLWLLSFFAPTEGKTFGVLSVIPGVLHISCLSLSFISGLSVDAVCFQTIINERSDEV